MEHTSYVSDLRDYNRDLRNLPGYIPGRYISPEAYNYFGKAKVFIPAPEGMDPMEWTERWGFNA